MARTIVALLGGALVLLMFGCASSNTGAACDPAAESCTCSDVQPCPSGFVCESTSGTCVVDVDASTTDAPTDARRKGFGEPCLDRNECESEICILVGASGGRCTRLCTGGDCPSDWGCFGVIDIIEPGAVNEVCVPVVDQLCSACTTDAECTQIGADLCLTQPTGGRFCGRDCRSVACPSGFTCQDMSAGGEVIRQCVPTSGACDCDATSMGMTQSCTIMTPAPFSTTCGGTRTCQGAPGWGPCAPPSTTDDPDGSYTDDNCDGIDGDVSRGIFVAGGGSNTPTCGTSATSPCQTISYGIVRAATAGRNHVFVQTGTYNEVVVLVNGINVWGGYSFGWQRGPYSNPAHRVTITGGQDNAAGGDGEYLAVRAHDLIVPVTIGDLVIDAPNAVGVNASGNGRSSYGVHVESATVRLERVQILGGNGAPGSTGSTGADAALVDAQSYMHGTVGGNGDEFITSCNNSSRGGGGAAGSNTCTQSPSSRPMNGGGGGAGGTMDSSCTAGLCAGSACNARGGDNGGQAAYRNGSFGAPGSGGSGSDQCGPTTGGGVGFVQNGAGGSRQTGGTVANGYWYARGGTAGGTGENGGGGGGGGGAGGCDKGTDSYGAGGGGGGAVRV
ncbi:MAG TPA: hypothetical protein VM734_00950, partial [Kofleriaceae bacterium]|nr:hypothetical protein [Kofleriaceae bacterium]